MAIRRTTSRSTSRSTRKTTRVAKKPTTTRRASTARRTIAKRAPVKRPTTKRTTTTRRVTTAKRATVRGLSAARKPVRRPVRRIQSARRIIAHGPHSHLKRVQTAKRTAPKVIPKRAGTTPKKQKIGTISHYFNKIGVAVIETTNKVQKGERVSIEGSTTNFKQKVRSMQHNNKAIEVATRGKSVGLKVNHRVRRRDLVYRI